METISDIRMMQRRSMQAHRTGQRIAFVPTMGYLHEGHASLLREGRKRGDLLVLSIFVNPTQFGVGEDLDTYPRNFARDTEIAAAAGVDIIFAPEAKAIYPVDFATFVEVEGLTDTLCGKSRPGHFRGVTTVVCKLFNIVRPDIALFGRKDFQQLAVIRRMTEDLNLPVEIVGMPIVREPDGLAMSSRNVYLAVDERRQALALIDAIGAARGMVEKGERQATPVIEAVRRRIEREPAARIDYVQICDAATLADLATITSEAVLLLAVRVGATRLIDNAFLLQGR
ncbi:MAG: pantoate--beta-alanine ligase [Desulfuromonadales bacterium]